MDSLVINRFVRGENSKQIGRHTFSRSDSCKTSLTRQHSFRTTATTQKQRRNSVLKTRNWSHHRHTSTFRHRIPLKLCKLLNEFNAASTTALIIITISRLLFQSELQAKGERREDWRRRITGTFIFLCISRKSSKVYAKLTIMWGIPSFHCRNLLCVNVGKILFQLLFSPSLGCKTFSLLSFSKQKITDWRISKVFFLKQEKEKKCFTCLVTITRRERWFNAVFKSMRPRGHWNPTKTQSFCPWRRSGDKTPCEGIEKSGFFEPEMFLFRSRQP